eukprot:TRINITY_DN7324_c0_g1_i9.p1 TRINITY_DN7324_c0_g1~~TRINITY_DN7324_c0_g1_i9.p1  ORF type:complete len:531 (-),score=182.88 TRINITY_DN7324_c0_g1_i9:276-1868(-)
MVQEGKEDDVLMELTAKDLDKTLELFEMLRSSGKFAEPKKKQALMKELDTRMPELTSTLNEALREDVPLILKNAKILKVKGELLTIIFNKMVEDIENKGIWVHIKGCYDSLIECYINIFEYLGMRMLKEKKSDDRKNMENLMQEMNRVNTELKESYNKLKASSDQQRQMQELFEQEKQELLSIIMELQKENEEMSRSSARHSERAEQYGTTKGKPMPSSRRPYNAHKTYAATSPCRGLDVTKGKTLKQVKDLIFDIYLQKVKYDDKCAENGQPVETMEEYMYIYLNRVYGLKSLIIEEARGLIEGVKKYSSIDSDVALFDKILKHECDEDFRLVFSDIKATMGDLLKEHFKLKYKLKTEAEIGEMVKCIQRGEIGESYWTMIIEQMYSKEDCERLAEMVRRKVGESGGAETSARKMTREEAVQSRNRKSGGLPYRLFQKIVLDFQLDTHSEYLKNFTNLFKEVDKERNGVLNEKTFRELLGRMNLSASEEEVQRFLQIVDPYNNQRITYSECLSLLSSVPRPNAHRRCYK